MWPSCRRRGELVVIGALTGLVPLLATAGLAAAPRTVRDPSISLSYPTRCWCRVAVPCRSPPASHGLRPVSDRHRPAAAVREHLAGDGRLQRWAGPDARHIRVQPRRRRGPN